MLQKSKLLDYDVLISQKPEDLESTLLSGGIIAYPTEAIFGLGCLANNDTTINRLITLKGRSPDKGLILIASCLEQLEPYILPLNQKQEKTILSDQSHPVTWLVPARSQTSFLLTGVHSSLAIRIIKHPPILELCQLINLPLVSTSANYCAQASALTTSQVEQLFTGKIDAILDDNTGKLTKPSSIVDLISGDIIRN